MAESKLVHCRLNEIGLTFVSLSKTPPMTRLAACLLLAALITFAQGAARSRFETASIKPSGPDSRPGMSTTPGRLTFTKANLRRAIYIAYHLTPSEISGGPSWMDSFDFDITASLDPKDVIATASEQRQQILDALQVLLEDRFQLVLRRETKTQPDLSPHSRQDRVQTEGRKPTAGGNSRRLRQRDNQPHGAKKRANLGPRLFAFWLAPTSHRRSNRSYWTLLIRSGMVEGFAPTLPIPRASRQPRSTIRPPQSPAPCASN